MISCIITTYKRPISIVSRAINCVLNQSHQNKELIVVNDWPDDRLLHERIKAKISECEKVCKCKYILNDYNMGACAARNIGIRSSEGDWIAFLDDDDTWDNNYLETINAIIDKDDTDIIATDFRVIKKGGCKKSKIKRPDTSVVYETLLYYDCIGPTSTVVVKKQKIIEAGLFDVGLPARQDYDMWLRMCRQGARVSFVNQVLISMYRNGMESISSRGLNHVQGTEIVLKKLLKDKTLEPFYKDIEYAHYYESGKYSLKREQYDVARNYLKKSIAIKKMLKPCVLLVITYMPFITRFIKKVLVID